LNSRVEDAVGQYTHQQVYRLLGQKEGVEVLELNVQKDHVHMVSWIPPKYAVSELLGYLKGKLAMRIFQRYERFGRQYWGRHLWARGYCVSTVGLDEERIRQYVRWQQERERDIETQQKKLFE
jgi:putative transposase